MKIVVTGASGFLGARLADELLGESCELGRVAELVLVDAAPPAGASRDEPRVRRLALDLTAAGAAERALEGGADVVFHLAAAVSGHAEADFELGMRVNFDATRALLEAARRSRRGAPVRLVFASTVAVFGGDLPPVVDDATATTPQSSYGAAKAMSELLVAEYARRGFVDGRAVRLPTVSVRAGAANRAVTSFASGVVREPLAGLPAACPVAGEQRLWLASPRSVVRNLVRAAALQGAALGARRALALPGLSVSVAEMVAALRRVAGPEVAALVRFEPDAAVARMVASFPARFDCSRALRLGFEVDSDFDEIIRAYIRDDLKRSTE